MSKYIARHTLKASDVWTDTQQRVMLAIADTYVPSFEGEEAAQIIASLPKLATERQKELAPQFARDGYKNNPQLIHDLAYQAKSSLSTATLEQINLVLSLLGTRLGCLALMGTVGPFDELDFKTREQCLNRWVQLPIGLLRKAASGFKGISLLVWYRFHQPAWEAVGYTDGPASDWQEALQEDDKAEEGFDYVFENDKLLATNGEGEEARHSISTEVLIIGSGAGGGVAAQYLTSLGVEVLVVDKGSYLHPKDMKGREDQGYPELYDGGGLMAAEDGSINVLAGSTFGGGTVVNWSASLKPRHFVREAWSNKHHLPYFRSPLFTNDLNAVCQRMGVDTRSIKHNVANSLLALGAQRAGQPVEAVPQNTGGHVHYCGKCQLGCVSGHKQGGTVTWLKDAAQSGKGKFLTNCFIERILFAKDGKKKKNEAGRAIGALAIVDGKRVRIDATKAVIVSAGSIQTPAVLLRTPELKYNNQIGKRLHLHPTTVVTGFYDFPINPWQGGLLTMVSNAAELVDAEGWGSKIEVIASSPSIHAAFSHWDGAVEHKADMIRYNHAFELIIICRDRDAGEICIDKDGAATINYTISKHDQKSLLQGVLRACDIHMMAGACKIGTVQTGVSTFIPGVTYSTNSISNTFKQRPLDQQATKTLEFPQTDQNGKVLPESTTIPSTATPVEAIPRNLSDPAYVKWRKEVEDFGAQPYLIGIGSAHQMGSCRLGATPRNGALDPEGRVWGTKNVYVADASSLPEASGVNPMITSMATARSITRNVAIDLGVEMPQNAAMENAARQGRM